MFKKKNYIYLILFILLCPIISAQNFEQVLIYNITTGNGWYVGTASSSRETRLAQSFKIINNESTYNIKRAQAVPTLSSAVDGQYWIEIRNDNAGFSNGTLLKASNKILYTKLNLTSWNNWYFTNDTLMNNNTMYWFIIRSDETLNAVAHKIDFATIDGNPISDVNIRWFLDGTWSPYGEYDTGLALYTLLDSIATPNFIAPTPINNGINNTNVTIQVNCTNANSYLWFDNNSNPNTLVLTNSSTGTYNTAVTNSDTYYYKAGCWNITFSDNSSVYNWTYDVILPYPSFNSNNAFTINNESNINQYSSAFGINITFNDNNGLFGYDILVSGFGSRLYNSTNTSLNNATSFIFYKLLSPIVWNVGRINTTVAISDTHTNKKIKDYIVEKSNKKLKFTTEHNIKVTIESEDDATTDAEKKKDRYEFIFNFTDGLTKDRTLYIKTQDEKIKYFPDSKFNGHFVVYKNNSIIGNWIDFSGYDRPTVTIIDDKYYKIDFINLPPNVKFKSIGGLNTYNQTFSWYNGNYSITNPNAIGDEQTRLTANVSYDSIGQNTINAVLYYNGSLISNQTKTVGSNNIVFDEYFVTPNNNGTLLFYWNITIDQKTANDYSFLINGSQNIFSKPNVRIVNISPFVAYTNKTLLGNCNITDDNINSINYSWTFLNGSVIYSFGITTNLTSGTYFNVANVSNLSTNVGENWTLRCRGISTIATGTWKNTSKVIQNTFPPNITGFYPTTNITIPENTTQFFNVTAVDTPPLLYEWFVDGVFKVFTQFLNYLFDFASAGIHLVTVNVTDATNKVSTMSWIVNVTNLNLNPNIHSLTTNDTTPKWLETVRIYCNTSDPDNETATINLTVDINYRLPSGFLWNSTTESYEPSTGLWYTNITIPVDGATVGKWDFRCRANDGISYSLYTTELDLIEVFEFNIAPTIPTYLQPSMGTFDMQIPIFCTNSTDVNTFNDNLTYDIEAYYKVNVSDSQSWKNISIDNVGGYYIWDINNFPSQANVDLRCRSKDSANLTLGWFNNNGTLIFNELFNLDIMVRETYMSPGTEHLFGLYCDAKLYDNISIIATIIDCNSDDIAEYYFEYNLSWNKKEVTEWGLCIIPNSKTSRITSSCILQKNRINMTWSNTICSERGRNETYCHISTEHLYSVGDGGKE